MVDLSLLLPALTSSPFTGYLSCLVTLKSERQKVEKSLEKAALSDSNAIGDGFFQA